MSSMRELIDGFDWAGTPIGPRGSWPQSLRTSVSICLASRFPILIWWGPDLIKLYNDAYAPILGHKHPHALGASGRSVWPEIWNVIGPMLEGVMGEGNATWSDDQLLMLERHGYSEECYFTFSYSPIVDESGGVGGIFTVVTETTTRVVGERRLDTLRQLAGRAGAALTIDEACHNAGEILRTNARDVPFAALHVADRCVTTVGNDGVANRIEMPLTIPGEEEPIGRLVAGISPHRALDDGYRSFFNLVAGHISSAIANAKAHEIERQRAEALAELDRAKTAFFSNVSHEFRTPLTLMIGPLEDVLEQDKLPPEARERLEAAHRNSLRLLKLVNSLLDFSCIEAGRSEAAYEPLDLGSFTAELAGVFRSAIERAGLRLVVNCQPLPEPVFVDREKWEKIVLNLVSNAFKFTFDGEIEVSLRQIGESAQLTVRDTGTGIPAGELRHLFERFHRVRGARSRSHEGSGIGLALVQELVKLHGGTVSATSEPGRGTTFTVTIPRGRAQSAAGRTAAEWSAADPAALWSAADPAALLSKNHAQLTFAEEATRWLPDDPKPSSPGPHPSGRVLVADDNADMRDYVRRLLMSRYEVETVADGAAAFESAQRHPPDLVLADVMMPGLDGFELLRALRAEAGTRDVSVILLSARAGEESKVEGMEAGADDYLVKPFSARELVARVDAHVRLQRMRRHAEKALRESENKFSIAFERSPLALTITSLDDGRLVEVNEGFERLSGYTRGEAIGRPPDELGLWVDPETRAGRFALMRAGLPVQDIEARFRIRNGTELIGLVGSAVVEINGRPCVLSTVSDITERKKAEVALRESESRLREFANTAPAMLWITEPDGLCSFLSRGWYEFTGQTQEQALGFGWSNAVHAQERATARQLFFEANEKRQEFSMDFRVRRVDGEDRWVNATGRPRYSSSSEFLGFVGSVIDITERKHAEQAKDEFLATLSHELRTPLTSAYGWVKLLARTREPEVLEQGLRAIEESLLNQIKLIDELLDVSRIASGKMSLDMQPHDLGAVVEGAVEMVRASAQAKAIALRVWVGSVLPVRGDAGRLKQVVWNLLTNAIKFTPGGGSVDVEARQRGSFAEIVVRDTGEGIDPGFLPQLFQRFRQADSSTSRRHGGLGIGLSIVASLVESHNGTVRAESDGLGKGARFTVTIPLLQSDVVVPTSGVAIPVASLRGRRVVVVDDDAGARQMITMSLAAAGAEVRECGSAAEAFELVCSWRADVLVSDVAMPGEDGYSLVRRLRGAGFAVPAIAITAYARPEDEARVREAGFSRRVTKPFDPAELLGAVSEV
ncbi:MAG TPA: ATP-binding protein [Thermoanaerobaculia bacterium]|nr:ATP-binding protein [Thermoanaerobaculia bacterium]